MNRKPESVALEPELQPGRLLELDPARVKPFADQPRKRFRGIKQLAESIRLIGQVTPILVTACDDDGYEAELVDGERRLRACLLGNMPVKAILDEDEKAADRYVRSVAANFCRQTHDAVEIMHAVRALRQTGKPWEEVAGIFGKTTTWAMQYASLARLAPAVLKKLEIAGDEAKQTRAQRRRRGRMTFSVALLLVPLPHEQQIRAMQMILRDKMSIAQARTAVQRLAISSGVKVGTSMTTREKFRAVSSAVENCYHVIERYVTMPGVQIGALIRGATRQERRRVSERLESLCENLLALSDAITREDKR